MRRQESGQLLLLLAVILAALLGIFFYLQRGSRLGNPQTQNNSYQAPRVENSSDLDNASSQLDKTDIDSSIDQGLKQNDQDSSSF